jgi:hypothetical protein
VIENRAFLRRAVTFLAAEAGTRQFLDIGTGIPTSPNVHEIAQGITPSARVGYVDTDPIVLSHARALMTSSPDGETAYIDADLLDLDKILNDADLRRVLDMSEPVALMLVAVLHFIPNDADPCGIVARLVDALPPGSHLVMSHATYDFMPPQTVAKFDAPGPANRAEFHARTREEFARFFDGLELLPPGIASIAEWRADNEPAPRPEAADVAAYGAVARKP